MKLKGHRHSSVFFCFPNKSREDPSWLSRGSEFHRRAAATENKMMNNNNSVDNSINHPTSPEPFGRGQSQKNQQLLWIVARNSWKHQRSCSSLLAILHVAVGVRCSVPLNCSSVVSGQVRFGSINMVCFLCFHFNCAGSV